ncbi:kinase-like domain-containing protein, partial [Circinella umbellata]
VTIKYVEKTRVVKERNQKKKTSLPLEIEILKRLQQNKHSNCCEMLMYSQDEAHYKIVMKNYGKTLFNFIEDNPGLTEPYTRQIFKQIAYAIHHLHEELGIIHRDIKDENVMIDGNLNIRLIDFGSAAYIKTDSSNNKYNTANTFNTFVGTVDYASPEVLTGNNYTGPPQDIWALGVLLYTIVHHSNPFHSAEEVVKRKLIFPFELPTNLRELIDGMLDPNIDSRLNIQNVVKHKWLL